MNHGQSPLGSIAGNVDCTTVEQNHSRSLLQVTVSGWMLHTLERVTDLYFEVAGALRSRTERTERVDIERNYPDIPYARQSGYTISLEFPGNQIPTPFVVHLFATLESGQRIATHFEVPINLPEEETSPTESAELPEIQLRQIALRNFLASGGTLNFPVCDNPKLSVIIVTFNRASDTFACLSALQAQATAQIEVLIVDNHSTDQTAALLAAAHGARLIQNSENVHFLRAACQGADSARGELLLFLNNDALVLPGGIAAAIASFEDHPRLGVLGARLIHLTGKLQEVGGSLLSDGSNVGNGVGEHPLAVPYLIQRSVDYCSGAFLVTPKKLWFEIGGFDPRYTPAYYEDVDYCVAVQQRGFEVLVEPRITVLHAEGATTHNSAAAKELMLKNREKFREKQRSFLEKIPPIAPDQRPLRPPQCADRRHILMIDDFFPRSASGQGAPRAKRILEHLHAQGCRITFVALNEALPADLPVASTGIEYRAIRRGGSLLEYLSLHGGSFGSVIISRPHNMEEFHAVRREYPICAGNAQVIYDAEAIFALREIRKQELLHARQLPVEQVERIVSQEILRVKHAHVFWAVSAAEALEFAKRGLEPVHTVSYGVELSDDSVPLSSRKGLLFVGPIINQDTPNGEGFHWFKDQVLPLLQAAAGGTAIQTTHVGIDLLSTADPLVLSQGSSSDLESFYGAARVFIAPIRFGSGIPLKVIEAAAHGLPIVCTSYIAQQLGWEHMREVLIADDAATFSEHVLRLCRDDSLWQKMHQQLRARVATEFSLTNFQRSISQAIDLSTHREA